MIVRIYRSISRLYLPGGFYDGNYRKNIFEAYDSKHFQMSADPDASFEPPKHVRGMTVLDRDAFKKLVSIPQLTIDESIASEALKVLKPFMLKLPRLQPIAEVAESSELIKKRRIYLDPRKVSSLADLSDSQRDHLSSIGVKDEDLKWNEINLTYENWKADQVLKSILPADQDSVAGYSIIGHILHLNLRDHFAPYRFIIGQILLDKTSNVSLVVNKVKTIENEFRNFPIEVLAGSGSTVTKVKEYGCTFELDFAEVYWNPRLSTEHRRIVEKLNCGDILFDVFAGIGPFAIPASKKNCVVHANDKNPHSYNWLQKNADVNKVKKHLFKAYNMDGREFIKAVIKPVLLSHWKGLQSSDEPTPPAVHIVMNLPALAVEFLDTFRGLLAGETALRLNPPKTFPTVHCYSFVIGKEEAIRPLAFESVSQFLGKVLDPETTEFSIIRNVAPNKEMVRLSFPLTMDDILFNAEERCQNDSKDLPDCSEPLSKRLCVDGAH